MRRTRSGPFTWIDVLLARFLKYFVIEGSDGSPYMVRFYVIRLPFFRIHLHHILRSDQDGLHDHPWNFVSVVLFNGYLEETPRGKKRIRAGSVVRHKSTDAHRLILGKPAWTLVFCLGRKRTWGFFTEAGWVPFTKYFDDVKFGPGNYHVAGS